MLHYRWIYWPMLVFLWSLASSALSYEKYLIKMPGPKAALAKKFRSGGDGVYHFTLDPGKTVKQDSKEVPVTVKIVKKSLEKKLRRFKVKVKKGKGPNKIKVTWNPKKIDEKKFLQKVAKTWIKASGKSAVQIAGTVSDGGVRARSTARNPVAGEVQARVLKVSEGTLIFKVIKKGPDSPPIPVNQKLQIKPQGFSARTGQMFYFKPTREMQGFWEGSGFSGK